MEKCISDAKSAIDSDRNATKALFRRAQAYEKLGRMEDACRDLYALVRTDASNKPGRKAYARVKKQVRQEARRHAVRVRVREMETETETKRDRETERGSEGGVQTDISKENYKRAIENGLFFP